MMISRWAAQDCEYSVMTPSVRKSRKLQKVKKK